MLGHCPNRRRGPAQRFVPALALAALFASACSSRSSGSGPSGNPPTGAYDPPWATVPPTETLSLDYDPLLDDQQNGATLKQAIESLTPGQRLEIGSGTYSIAARISIVLQGTAQAPIWIAAQSGATPVITRPDAAQNALNIGDGGQARYLALQGLEITGGDTAVKMYDCDNVWIDRCHVHDCGGVGIAANSADTQFLYLTRNEIHDTGGSAEGMYLGANNSASIMRHSIIALNHVYNCYGTQGDGIEVKQGSYDNWIVENHVHDCQYPCIIAYGTDGNPVNVIERNICYNSGDNVMQVQGQAIVRNNLIMAGAVGFHSHDHQGQTRDLTVVHNTIINSGRATNLSSWNNRAGMVFANNVVYSEAAESIRFPNGSTAVQVAGNVVLGPVSGISSGFVTGSGLADFVNVTWDATQRDATPAPGGAILGTGDPLWAVSDDLTGATRVLPLESGCYDGL